MNVKNDNKILTVFAVALNALLHSKNMRQADLVRASGVGQSTISQASNAKRMPVDENLLKIANSFGRTYAEMISLGEILQKEQSGKELNPVEKHQKRRLLGTHRPENKNTYVTWNGEDVVRDQNKIYDLNLKVLSNEHRSIIDSFRDKVSAYEINKKLLEIERLDPEKFDEIKAQIDFIYNRLLRKKIANGD